MGTNLDALAVESDHPFAFDSAGITAPPGFALFTPVPGSYITSIELIVDGVFDAGTAVFGQFDLNDTVIASELLDTLGTVDITSHRVLATDDPVRVILSLDDTPDGGDPQASEGSATLRISVVAPDANAEDAIETALHQPLGSGSYAANDPASPVASPNQAPNTKVGAPGYQPES